MSCTASRMTSRRPTEESFVYSRKIGLCSGAYLHGIFSRDDSKSNQLFVNVVLPAAVLLYCEFVIVCKGDTTCSTN